MHIEQLGQGPDLVLLHGWGLHAGVWESLRAPLARRYRLHLVDLPGYGRSRDIDPPTTTEELAAALVQQTPAGALWLGWSLGAQIALLAAHRSPEHVHRLVLVAATPCFVTRAGWPMAMAPDVFSDFSSGLLQDWRATLTRFLGLMAADPRHDRDMLQALRVTLMSRGEPATARSLARGPRLDPIGEPATARSLARGPRTRVPGVPPITPPIGEPATAALAGGLEWLRHNDLRPLLGAIRQDTLLIQGDRDRLVPTPATAAMAAMMPNARTCLVAGAGHAPFLSHPDLFLSRLETFLAEAA
ncbi:MAG: alpha/beta fold hydrolase [Pseudomonadota bacterium]